MDDLTLVKAVNLKTTLRKENESDLVRPLTFHQRTERILPDETNYMLKEMRELEKYCEDKKLEIKSIRKQNLCVLNFFLKYGFPATNIPPGWKSVRFG